MSETELIIDCGKISPKFNKIFVGIDVEEILDAVKRAKEREVDINSFIKDESYKNINKFNIRSGHPLR